VQQLLFRAEHGFVNIFCASAPKGGPGSATAVETILPTRRNVVESRAAGNTASRAASRVTQKIRAIRLAGKKKCAQDRNRLVGAVHKSRWLTHPRPKPRGIRREFGGWRMGFNGPPCHAPIYRHCAANPVNLSSSLKLDLALSAAMSSRARYAINAVQWKSSHSYRYGK
jgi:hypothetical protein